MNGGRMEEHEYLPDVRAFVEAIREYSPRRILLLGDEDLELDGVEVRVSSPPELVLSNGVFVFRTESGVDALISVNGSQPAVAERVDFERAPADHPIVKARSWFEFLWSSAVSVDPTGRFAAGDFAVLAGTSDPVRILEAHRDSGHTSYTVQTPRGRRTVTEEGLQELPTDDADPLTWVDQPPASAREFTTSMTVTKLQNPLTDTVYSYLSSKTVMYPYQFKPVLRLLRSPHQRLLIADEVGLGKTIEAGLIWSELDARHGGLERVLVVCPAALVNKWQVEMRRRFDRRVPILGSNDLREMFDVLAAGGDQPVTGIVSLERLRNPVWLEEMTKADPRFDLIIVDEAHYLRNRETRSHELGTLLSSWSDVLIFLSATPLNLGNDDLFNLLSLLVPEEFDDPHVFPAQVAPNEYVNSAARRLAGAVVDPGGVLRALEPIGSLELGRAVTSRPEYARGREICESDGTPNHDEVAEVKRLLAELNTLSGVLTRTRKVDVPQFKAEREPREVKVVWTPEEASLYEGIRQWAMTRARKQGGVPGFTTQMPLRQAASCLPAAVERTAARIAAEGWATEDDFDDLPTGQSGGSAADDHEFAELDDLRSRMEAIEGIDSKFDAFVAYLEKHPEERGQVLLFSFFRATLSYLHRRLSELGFNCEVLHGGVRQRDRQPIMDAFRDGDVDILLCSEVGSEGLDFEFCNMVVNYDLPWNPMRVEQRIGRLDRFGQEHEKIFVLNFHVPGTIETDIFERLYERIGVFQRSIGELEPILRSEVNDIMKVALDPELTPEQREERLARVEVATAERTAQLDDIRAAQAQLSGLDQLLIDGFESDTQSRGRFVGPEELENLLGSFFADLGEGRIKRVKHRSSDARREITGGADLGDLVARIGDRRGTRLRPGELSARLRDEDPILVTFSNEDASRTDVELLSLHHPLARAAVAHLADRPLGVKRFASLCVEGLPNPDHRYVVVVYLAETSGLRPSLELWPLAVDLETGSIAHDCGDVLLNSLARCSAGDGPGVDPAEVRKAVSVIVDHARRHQREEESRRRRDNEALVDVRLETRRAGVRNQIRRAEQALSEVRRSGGNPQIVRLRTSQIRNLEAQLARLPEEMDEKRALALTTEAVAVAVLHESETSR